MTQDVVTIHDSDEDEVTEVPNVRSARPVFRARDRTSQVVNKYAIVDLTEDDGQDVATTAVPNRTIAGPSSTNSPAHTHALPRHHSPARSKAAPPIVPSSDDDDDELPHDPTPNASFSRRLPQSDPKSGPKTASSSSLRNTSHPSSPNKRLRDQDSSIKPPHQPGKRRRVLPHEETRDVTRSPAFRSRLLDVSRSDDLRPSAPKVASNDRSSGAGASAEAHIDTLMSTDGSRKSSPARHDAAPRNPVDIDENRQAKRPKPDTELLEQTSKDSNTKGVAHSDPVVSRRKKQTVPLDRLDASSHSVDNESHALANNSNLASTKRRKEKNVVPPGTSADGDDDQPSKAQKTAPLSHQSPVIDRASAGASPSSQLYREAGENYGEPYSGAHMIPEIAVTSDSQVLEPEPQESNAHLAAELPVLPDIALFPVERQVERVLGKYYQEMREDTDYFTKAWLKRSRRSIELHRSSRAVANPSNHRSDQSSVASAVFARLRTAAVMLPTTATAKISNDNLKFSIDVYNRGNKPARGNVKAKPSRCDVSSIANDVPEYAHYVSLKTNVLAPNTTTMTVWPYFGDGEPDPEEFENYYRMDTDQRHRKIRRLLESQKVEEYIESALQDLHITWDDVLRFLLVPNPDVGTNAVARSAILNRETHREDFPRVEGSKKWMGVLSSLRENTQEQLVKAAILCDNFQRMAKFPLWHVARRSEIVKRTFDAQDTPASSVESRVCGVCLQFNCHQHGELQESYSDSDSGAETDDAVAKDVLYPLRVNFRKRVSLPQSPPASPEEGAMSANAAKARKAPKYWDNSNYTAPGDWPPFYSCNHPGLTCESAECSCFVNKRPCEKSCACPDDCVRKFHGCSCASFKHRKPGDYVCWRDDRCACYKMGRECDPDLCGACGVCEVLDPVHRHDPDAIDTLKTCHNASIQKGVPKHTLLGDSGIHGMGLYAGQHIKAHEFVGEYKGEVITKEEADRRGAVYEKQKSTYLFSLNSKQEVDSNFYGNKIRFINHRNKSGANVYPLIMIVKNIHRIGLFAQQDIRAGEELFFDYGPKFPEHLLGGIESAISSKSAPHVRNANMVLNDFYDVEDDEDEAGNRRARKAPADSKSRGRARKPEPAAKPLKAKGKMGGARPGAGRKPGKKNDNARATKTGKKTADKTGSEDSRIASQVRFESYYVSQDKEASVNGDDGDDEDFVDGEASEPESSEDEDDSEDERVRAETSRYGRVRGRPGRMEL